MTSEIPISTDAGSQVVTELIHRLKVRDAMTKNVVTCSPDDTIRTAQKTMREASCSGVPIVKDRRLVGIFSVDDVINSLDRARMDERLEHHMTRNVIVLEDDMPLSFAISYHERYRFGRFPVLNSNSELVGIITSRDTVIALLVAINREVERLEQKVVEDHGPNSGFLLEYGTRSFAFENAGRISTDAKRALKERGVAPKDARRVAIATYELEMNQVVHSAGGRVSVEYHAEQDVVDIVARDNGPGIPDIDAALTEGFSTANQWVRSLGFGAGMGLPNVARVADGFSIESDSNGTCVKASINTHRGPES